MELLIKVESSAYGLTSIQPEDFSSDFTFHPPWSLDMFINMHLPGEYTDRQPFRRLDRIVHIVTSVLQSTHLHLS